MQVYIAPVVPWTDYRSLTLDSTSNRPLGCRASVWCRRDEMFFVDLKGGKGRTTTAAVLSETSASLLLKCLRLFPELDTELSRFTRRGIGRMTYVSFPTQLGALWTQIRSAISSTLWNGPPSCTKTRMVASNLVLLFHGSSGDNDGALAPAYCKTTKTASNVRAGITHSREGQPAR